MFTTRLTSLLVRRASSALFRRASRPVARLCSYEQSTSFSFSPRRPHSTIVDLYEKFDCPTLLSRQLKPEEVTWMPPVRGQVKLNTHGLSSEERMLTEKVKFVTDGSQGALLRDDEGRIIFAFDKYCATQTNTLVCEAEAIVEGLELAQELRYRDIIVEFDSEQFEYIYSMRGKWVAHRDLENAMKRLEKLSSEMKFTLQRVPREANRVANGLSKKGMEDKQIGRRLYTVEDIEDNRILEALILRDQKGISTLKNESSDHEQS